MNSFSRAAVTEYDKPSGLKQQKLCTVHWCLANGEKGDCNAHSDFQGCIYTKGGLLLVAQRLAEVLWENFKVHCCQVV